MTEEALAQGAVEEEVWALREKRMQAQAQEQVEVRVQALARVCAPPLP